MPYHKNEDQKPRFELLILPTSVFLFPELCRNDARKIFHELMIETSEAQYVMIADKRMH